MGERGSLTIAFCCILGAIESHGISMAYAALNATSLASAEAKSSVDYSNVDEEEEQTASCLLFH
jgi:hypothetical protein